MEIGGMKVPMIEEEECQNMKKVLGKYGTQVVCDEDEKPAPDLVLPASEECENAKKVVSKYGYQVVCDDEQEK